MLPLENQAFIRSAYGVLLFLEFLIILPFSRVYFTTEKYRGCINSSKILDFVFSPAGCVAFMAFWMGTAAMLAAGVHTVPFALINVILCYLCFVRMRWTSITRGMGAPGLMPYWLAAFVFCTEYATYCGDPQGNLRSLVIRTFRFDFAVMMIDSGINKIFHGFNRNYGMNWGMANPAWGYWPETFRKFPYRHLFFDFLNHSAYLLQILGGILMLIPGWRWTGAFIIGFGFLTVKALIRLGVLCDMLALITFIYTEKGGWVHQFLLHWMEPLPLSLIGSHEAPYGINALFSAALWAYMILLPLAKLGMYYNFYGRKRLPAPVQKFLEVFTNTFGIILWRVFTIETVDFFTRVHFENKSTKERTPYTRFGRWKRAGVNRFLWVGESVMMDSVFNTIRYYPDSPIFRQRLLRYANTMPHPAHSRVIFEYVALCPDENGYHYIPAKEFIVDPEGQTIEQKILNASVEVPLKHEGSPVRATSKPGSYAPSAKG